jgi:hypothetical protein
MAERPPARGPIGPRIRELLLNSGLVVAAGIALALLVSMLLRAVIPSWSGASGRGHRSAEAGLRTPEVASELAEPGRHPGAGGREIRVQVLNGCGVPGAGAGMASVLRQAGGLDVIEIGNADQFDFETSLVLDRTGDSAPARQVARALDGAPVLRQRVADAQSDVTVIVGYDGGRWLSPLPTGGGR